MSDFKERLVEEKKQLSDRLSKLKFFFISDEFDGLSKENKILLTWQRDAMTSYLNVLSERLELLGCECNDT